MASGPIPPSSSLFDPLADLPVAYDPAAATAADRKAGWTQGRRRLAPAQGQAPLTIELVSPDKAPTRPPSQPPEVVAATGRRSASG